MPSAPSSSLRFADIHPENAENIGLVLRGRRFHHGEPHLHYAITAAEYRAPDDQA